MSFTVSDILKMDPLVTGKLVAGNTGLSNMVCGVTVLEVSWIEIPEGQVFTTSGDLVISSMYSVMNSVEEQIQTIRMLKEQNASGLILCHIGMVIKELSPRVIEECDRLALPLVIMPPYVGYSAIISVVSSLVLTEKNRALGNKVEIYDSIIDLLLHNQSTHNIIANLSRLIGCRTLYFNQNLRAEERAGLSDDYLIYIQNQVRKHVLAFMDSFDEITIPGYQSGPPLLLYPLYSNILYYGVIVVEKEHELSDLDEAAILQTKNALYIMRLNKTDIFEYRTRLLTEYIDDLIHNYSSNEQLILNRSSSVGHDLIHTQAVIVADIFGFERLATQLDEQKLQALKQEFMEQIGSLLRKISPKSIGCNISDKYVILFTENLPKEKLYARLRFIGQEIQKTLAAIPEIKASVGIGSSCQHFRDIKNSYQSALAAIFVSNRVYKVPRIVFSNELPVYQFMLQSIQKMEPAFRQLETDLMEPLRSYDKSTNGCLEKTFLMLLECDMDTTLVSKKMYLHKNTVLQRKKKIAELYQGNPFDLINRLQFQFVRILRDLIDTPSNNF